MRVSPLKGSCEYENDLSACYLLQAGFLHGFFYNPEDGGEIFLRNIGGLSMECTALYPRRYKLSQPPL
jgi:hypothetical protein